MLNYWMASHVSYTIQDKLILLFDLGKKFQTSTFVVKARKKQILEKLNLPIVDKIDF